MVAHLIPSLHAHAAMSKSKDREGGVVLSFGGQWVSWAHTIAAYSMSIL